mgnify:CR=1 FL=1
MKLLIALTLCCFLNIINAQKNISFLGNLQYSEKINDIWGYSDNLGNEYALVGSTTGTSIVNVTNPNLPEALFFIPGDTSIWRDLKTYNNFAYVTNEESGGLLIIDLNNLPNNIDFQYWKVDTLGFETAHNIFIDENGIAYLFGSNIKNQGALMLDLNVANKYEPPLIGIYDDRYVHDGFVRDNVMWTAEVFDGDFSVVDITNKQNPIVLARQKTSSSFTHQCWLSDDNNYLITNDERSGAYIDIYDVSDLNNIKLLDKYRSSPDDSLIPHNNFFIGNDYFFTSYYRDGITLVDATKKDNIVEVGNYDTSPFSAADGFEGCWGVYPYLPSGNILASDREEGLFILKPEFTRACYLEGDIRDTTTNSPLKGIRVEIMGTDYIKESNFDGSYRTGVPDSGVYDIRFSRPFCKTVIVSGVTLLEAQVFDLDIETNCDFPLEIQSTEDKSLVHISPNPFNENLKMSFKSAEKLQKITVTNINGSLIKEIVINEYKGEVNFINNWKSGIYFLKCQFESFSRVEKIQKIN